MTNTTLTTALDQLDQAEEPAPVRCTEMTRTDRGYERCRRDADGHDRHHVRHRAWSTGGRTPRLDLGHVCGPDCCRWPELVAPYLGYAPRAGDIKGTRRPARGSARK